MKKLLLLLFAIICISIQAQLDREHWFAPMMDRVGNSSQFQSIYMSTNEINPFKVDVYHNNIIVGSVTISKNNPVKYSISNSVRNTIITSNPSDLFKPVAMGYYLKGDRPFFASLRFSVLNHGEIQTSKGTAGLGTEFRAVMAPITVSNGILNFMNSIMATEDNTSVTINGFQPNVHFADNISRTQITFTLNKGQSYLIEGTGSFSQNFSGYIGAKIVSDKPVVIANGNFNGQYAGNISNSSDILMDQGVPVDKLGQEFVLMKGNGDPGSEMEKALILATEDNTQIYVNNGTTPVATINAGQYYITNSSAYLLQTFGHYNMFVKATKNVYVYQLLAGASSSTGTEAATGGFNYIPPLNCYLPKRIDEIGKIEENEYSSNGVYYSLAVPTKLNIITESGANITVTRNGTPMILGANNGPFDVTGNANWKTYSIPNITGNIAIISTQAVTAGISAGNDAVGYGGYFAGFSAIPLITKTVGDCLPGVKLEVTEGFDSYLWLLKVGTAYIPAPGINNTYAYEPTQAGIYAVQVKQGSCPQIQTQDFKFYNCTTYTNYDRNSCGTELVEPTFALSSQAVNPITVKIVEAPTKGTIPTNPDGTIILDVNGRFTYTANPGVSGIDKFKYSFCGLGAIPDCETVQITVIMIEKRDDAILQECSINGIATYNLSLANVSSDTTLTKSYFITENGAQNDIAAERITAFTSYTSPDTSVYARLVNSFGCIATAKIELKSKLAPEVKENLYTKLHCDEDIDGQIDGVYKVDLATITPIVLVQASNFVVKYYSDAGLANLITGTYSFTGNTSIWIKVDAPNGCPSISKEIQLRIGTKATLITLIDTKVVCDISEDNSEAVNLNDYIPLFNVTTGTTATYYNSIVDAQNNQNAIVSNQIITGNRTFYYRLMVPGFCIEISTLNIILSKGTPTALLNSYTVCAGDSVTLEAEGSPIYHAWLWKKGSVTVSTTQTASLNAGVYTVSFTNALGCIFTKTITVVDSPIPVLNIAAFNATNCDDDFDGIINVNLLNVTPAILPNSTLYTVKYYTTQDFADAGGTNNLPNNWSYTTDTTIFVRVQFALCPYITGVINFKVGNDLSLLKPTYSGVVCDDDFDGLKSVDLQSFVGNFYNGTSFTVTYYNNLADAQNSTNQLPSVNVTVDNTAIYYLRFQKSNFCDVIGKLDITIQKAKKSDLLIDQSICPEAVTTLDVGSGFDGILWSTGEITQMIDVPIGDYYVDLQSGQCTYRQSVSVKAVDLPIITSVEIKGSTITVNVTGGTPPYQYAIDNGNYQSSNIFTNVRGGDHTVYVISADNCAPISADINVIEIYNAITPNGDGINDVLNYEALLNKDEPFLQIFDRYGMTVFTGDKNNRFSWDGKSFGKLVKTGSYWYVMKWKEPGFSTFTEYSGWVLVKNRE